MEIGELMNFSKYIVRLKIPGLDLIEIRKMIQFNKYIVRIKIPHRYQMQNLDVILVKLDMNSFLVESEGARTNRDL